MITRQHIAMAANRFESGLKSFLNTVLALVGIAVFGWMAWSLFGWVMPDDSKWKYVVTNNVPYDHVTISPRPTDCDFDRSPIGNKACHYEKQVAVIPPCITGVNALDGTPLMSCDQGHSWETATGSHQNPPAVINQKRTEGSVIVTWEKVKTD